MKYYVLGFISAILIAFAVAIGFALGQQGNFENSKNRDGFSLSPTLRVLPTLMQEPIIEQEAVNIQEQLIEKDPIEELEGIVIKALNNRTYSDLVPVMADEVWVRWENSVCCTKTTAQNSIVNMRNLNNSRIPWEIPDDNPDTENIVAIYPEHYKGTVIAISANSYLAAFQLDDEDKINKISISTNYKTLLP